MIKQVLIAICFVLPGVQQQCPGLALASDTYCNLLPTFNCEDPGAPTTTVMSTQPSTTTTTSTGKIQVYRSYLVIKLGLYTNAELHVQDTVEQMSLIKTDVLRGLSGKFADTANKTHIVYHSLMKFCIINISYRALCILNMTECF